MTITPGFPRLNEPAPHFEARTTHGPVSLASYRGRWLVLFAHPADFTPVCTTEFIAFARAHDRFQTLNCDLLGLSIDSVFAHLAWTRNISEKFGVEIPFPIIEDISMNVANAYGMVHPGAADTQAVRATFVIDPESRLRAMIYYPMSNGRSVEEILRLVTALQTSDTHGVATPEAWCPGDKVIVSRLRQPQPPAAMAVAQRSTCRPRQCSVSLATTIAVDFAADAVMAMVAPSMESWKAPTLLIWWTMMPAMLPAAPKISMSRSGR